MTTIPTALLAIPALILASTAFVCLAVAAVHFYIVHHLKH